MPRHALQERQVRAVVRAFHHIIKISDGLMRVYENDQVEFLQERTSSRADKYNSAVAVLREIQIPDEGDRKVMTGVLILRSTWLGLLSFEAELSVTKRAGLGYGFQRKESAIRGRA